MRARIRRFLISGALSSIQAVRFARVVARLAFQAQKNRATSELAAPNIEHSQSGRPEYALTVSEES
jgi:hypothetical protein